MFSHQNVLRNRLYQVNQTLFCYRTYETYTVKEIIDTAGIGWLSHVEKNLIYGYQIDKTHDFELISGRIKMI